MLSCEKGLGDYTAAVDSPGAEGLPLRARVGEDVGAKFGEGSEEEGIFEGREGGVEGGDGFYCCGGGAAGAEGG